MAILQNLPRRRKPSFLTSVGNKVKTAFEYGMQAKAFYDMGKGIYQGVSTYGPMLYNAAKAIGPIASTIAAIL